VKNVIITLDEAMGEREKELNQREALERFLNGSGFPGIAANLPTREELYAERLFPRQGRTALNQAPENSDKVPRTPLNQG
jgi:hypothetical protein